MAKPRNRPTQTPSEVRTYAVGYGKPPTSSRFKRGKCPNPGGRPKGSKNKAVGLARLSQLVLKEASRKITVKEGGVPNHVDITTGILRRVALQAFKGEPRQQRLWFELLAAAQAEQDRLENEFKETWIALKLKLEQQIDREIAAGRPPPKLDIHPEQIVVDYYEGTVEIRGPLTREERIDIEDFVEENRRYLRDMVLDQIAQLEAELAIATDDRSRDDILARIEDRKELLETTDRSAARRLHQLLTGKNPLEDER